MYRDIEHELSDTLGREHPLVKALLDNINVVQRQNKTKPNMSALFIKQREHTRYLLLGAKKYPYVINRFRNMSDADTYVLIQNSASLMSEFQKFKKEFWTINRSSMSPEQIPPEFLGVKCSSKFLTYQCCSMSKNINTFNNLVYQHLMHFKNPDSNLMPFDCHCFDKLDMLTHGTRLVYQPFQHFCMDESITVCSRCNKKCITYGPVGTRVSDMRISTRSECFCHVF